MSHRLPHRNYHAGHDRKTGHFGKFRRDLCVFGRIVSDCCSQSGSRKWFHVRQGGKSAGAVYSYARKCLNENYNNTTNKDCFNLRYSKVCLIVYIYLFNQFSNHINSRLR